MEQLHIPLKVEITGFLDVENSPILQFSSISVAIIVKQKLSSATKPIFVFRRFYNVDTLLFYMHLWKWVDRFHWM